MSKSLYMKPFPAFAAIEFNSVPAGIFAADALLKKSPIAMIRSGTIGEGRYLILLAGTTASVEEAHVEALFHGGLQIADDCLLPDIHPALYHAILGNVRNVGDGPIWVLETPTVSCNIQATERALKGVPVELLEFRAGDPRMAGRGLAILQGDLYDIEAAQEIALATLEARGIPAQHRMLTAPHDALLQQISVSTRFDLAQPLDLEGETAS
jgi:microcompartment protein CcmL/EutN